MGGKITASGRGTTMSYGWLGSWLWPGLPQMWVAGRWWGFATAVGFGLAAEAWFLSVYVWNEMLSPPATRAVGIAVLGCWVIGVVANRRWLSRRRDEAIAGSDGDLFPSALAEYLQGNWFAAEQKCRDLIARRRDDVEARLLLATLLRHVGRTDEARSELDALTKIEAAAKWALEIAHERMRLDEADEDDAAEEENPTPEVIRRAA